MKLSTLRLLLAARYERLFTRRFQLENERDKDGREDADVKRSRRFHVAGAIFPTESVLSRYQY